ncbi:enoyl-CoA hydratase [Salipiger pallidus]|uniref:Enoyl-CoA hydratase domain-containing protein 3, mitochondrial n=1 Tax=Salipiger pallidus TaxID=1775170 RepID=A0A8J2ZGJ1_9RHOB|nr:enoyl-CoA hydratase [Salipiger pallidus]GGG59563.1 enoyl-CoA hydratase [Salipiger pallidus]
MDLLERHDTDAIANLTLNAPERLNALSDDMLAALQAQIEALQSDQSIRVVTIEGAGKVFCAGHDLKEMQQGRQSEDKGRAYFADLFARCSKVMTGLQHLPQPVIAKVHGIATAAGCQLVASCDMAVAAEGTKFGVNGVNIGLFCSTPMVALTRNIPAKQAFEMLTTGRFVEAEEALRLGLVNRVVPHDMLDTATEELAQRVAGKLGSAVRIGKEAFYEQAVMSVDDAYAYAADVMVENMLWRDTDEGISAFLEKRSPAWTQ